MSMEVMPLTVTDIRQFDYCPRVVYYTYVQPVERPVTYKMQHGAAAEGKVAALEKRRTLQRYGLQNGRRLFDCRLQSDELALSGKADMLVLTDCTVCPVKFKFTGEEVAHNHRLQVTAYAMMAEDTYQVPAAFGFICRLTDSETWRVETTGAWRDQVRAMLQTIRDMISAERFPPAPQQRGKCTDCEFRRFCGDV